MWQFVFYSMDARPNPNKKGRAGKVSSNSAPHHIRSSPSALFSFYRVDLDHLQPTKP